MIALAGKSTSESSELPIYKLNVDVAVDKRGALFKQLRLFSEKHAFAIRIAPSTPDDKHFLAQLWREDIKMIMVNPFDEGQYSIYFYQNNAPLQQDVVNFLASELRSFLEDIPGAVLRNEINE